MASDFPAGFAAPIRGLHGLSSRHPRSDFFKGLNADEQLMVIRAADGEISAARGHFMSSSPEDWMIVNPFCFSYL